MTGNNFVIKSNGTAILGQLNGTMTINGAHIDISDKDSKGNVVLHEGFIAGKQIQFAGEFLSKDDASQKLVKDASENGGFLDLVIDTGIGGEAFSGSFAVSGRSDAGANNDSVKMSVNFLSSGEVVYTAMTV